VYDQQGMIATWFPDRVLRVGDVISRSKHSGSITVEASIGDLTENPLPGMTSTSGPKRITFQRGASLKVAMSAEMVPSVTMMPTVDAEITFSEASSFVFVGSDGSSVAYDQLQLVRKSVLDLAQRGRWRDEWQLVTSVRTFKRCLLLIARESGSVARVSMESANGPATLESVKTSLGASITRGAAAKWELKSCTPLYEGLTLRWRTWSGPEVSDRYLDRPAATGEAEAIVVRVDPVGVGLN